MEDDAANSGVNYMIQQILNSGAGFQTGSGMFSNQYMVKNKNWHAGMPMDQQYTTEDRFNPQGIIQGGQMALGLYNAIQGNKFNKKQMQYNDGVLALQNKTYNTNLTQVRDQYTDKLDKLGIGAGNTNAERLKNRQAMANERYA